MSDPVTFTLADKHKAAVREANFRQRVYPKWVVAGRITAEKASHELGVMLAIAEDYRRLAEAEAEKVHLI